MNKPKVIVICGPTASGKTSLSIELAKKINGEIVSCDSMQIYKDMDIGLDYRNMLEKEAEENGLEKLYNKAKEIDPQAMEKVSQNDKKRIIRVLEIYNATRKE